MIEHFFFANFYCNDRWKVLLVSVIKGGDFAKFLWPSQDIWTLQLFFLRFPLFANLNKCCPQPHGGLCKNLQAMPDPRYPESNHFG